MARHTHSLFIFRRDLRLEDNTGLIRALESSEKVSTAFILDPEQADPDKNPYFSKNAFAFMVESLRELSEELENRSGKLAILHADPAEILASIEGIDAVFVNEDYTPYARTRDEKLRDACEARGIAFEPRADAMLNAPDEVLTRSGDAYRVFTPYYRAVRERDVRTPARNKHSNYHAIEGADVSSINVPSASPERTIVGGRSHALEILEEIESFANYRDERDLPARMGTTRLSAHLKFGTISARELHHAIASTLGAGHELARQLVWRDFYLQLLFHYPENLGSEFDQAYARGIAWDEPGERFEAWRTGRTGFPIIDAGMRELEKTGWMHNRVRMIVASFLTKDLHIDWREGEQHFARMLVDYDPANNNGGWQWAASTGADAAPYFRIFNPWLQQKKFDPNAEYIKQWVPELAGLDAATIHALDTTRPHGMDYPEPIVEHKAEREEALSRYKTARSR